MRFPDLWLTVTLLISLAPISRAHPGHETPASPDCDLGVESCVERERKVLTDRGVLGFLVRPVGSTPKEAEEAQWVIARVVPNSAAEEAGLHDGDIIVLWNGEALPAGVPEQFLRKVKKNAEVALVVQRGKEQLNLTATARSASAEIVEAWLLHYVHDNFSHEEFVAYENQVRRQRSP